MEGCFEVLEIPGVSNSLRVINTLGSPDGNTLGNLMGTEWKQIPSGCY
jgi:hypothetical protein